MTSLGDNTSSVCSAQGGAEYAATHHWTVNMVLLQGLQHITAQLQLAVCGVQGVIARVNAKGYSIPRVEICH
jgi:hypothetical protein